MSKISRELLYLQTWNFVHMTSKTSCIVGKKIRAMGPGPLELFPFVVLAILMAMAAGISEHMLTSGSSFRCSNATNGSLTINLGAGGGRGGRMCIQILICVWMMVVYTLKRLYAIKNIVELDSTTSRIWTRDPMIYCWECLPFYDHFVFVSWVLHFASC